MNTETRYADAREQYAAVGVDTDAALAQLNNVPISMNCWQADDVAGLEGAGEITGGGILATGNFPGKARTADQIRQDFTFAQTLIPGTHRFNLHASYQDHDGRAVDRDELEVHHFQRWIDWARDLKIGLDFNTTFFSHPKANGGFTLASRDKEIRNFWIEHGKRARRIAAAMGQQLQSSCMNNHWIPDGWKDQPADRLIHREILVESLDTMLQESFPETDTRDAVESKLFGIGSEAYVVGSHEFYLAYAITRGIVLCMDAGHYHPTESIAEKVSALLPFMPRLLLHVSRPVRWDSDHVVLFDDETRAILREVARGNAWDRVDIAVDFFDASINRVGAWTIGIRSTMKAALYALLEPWDQIRTAEDSGRLADRLALQEEAKTLPFGAVWDYFCQEQDVPVGPGWLKELERYESEVLRKRD